jgi:DNA-binding transcriptional MerR regulator
MIDLLKGGIIKGRIRRYTDEDRVAQNKEIDELRAKHMTDKAIAKRLDVSYATIAERSSFKTNY